MQILGTGQQSVAVMELARLHASALVAQTERWRQLSWRHHGVGMLQAELSPSWRIHVHHRSLVTMKFPRTVHDHRFDLLSAVLVGSVLDEQVRLQILEFSGIPEEGVDHIFDLWEINHAKIQTGDGRDLRLVGRVRVMDRVRTHLEAPACYRIPRGDFHFTQPDDLAVTLVHRHNFGRSPACVLSAAGTPESGIAHKPAELGREQCELISRAAESLRTLVEQDVQNPEAAGISPPKAG